MSSHGGDISDEVRSNQQVDASRDLHGSHIPARSAASGASSEQELQHSRQQSLEDMEEGGGGGRHGHEMSPLREVVQEPLRAHYGAVEGAVHLMGPAPGHAVVRGDRPEVRRGGENVFRGQLHDDQIPLVPEDGGNQQRGGLKACCKKYRNFICVCSAGLSLVVVALVFISIPGVIARNEKDKEYHVFTTANESNSVYTHSKVWLMESVCMIEDSADSEQLDWVLHTGSCSRAHVMARDFQITGQAYPSTTTGYYFYLVTGSSVKVSMNPDDGKAHYLFSTDAKKATDMDKVCGSGEGSEIPSYVFERTGYYFICIVPNQHLMFTMDIHELYYNRPITNECNNTEYYGSEKHRCCDIGFSDAFGHHNCVYLTTRNQQPVPRHMTRPHQVKVYLKYSDTVKALVAVLIIVLFVTGTTLLVSLAVCHIRKLVRRQ